MIAGLDTGQSNGLVIVNEAGEIVERETTKHLPVVWALLACHTIDIVVLERAAPTQLEYQTARLALSMYGFTTLEVSPGEWKPNPQCHTSAAETPGWTQHERDAYSLVKYYHVLQHQREVRERTMEGTSNG